MTAPVCVWPGLVELLGQAEVGDLGRRRSAVSRTLAGFRSRWTMPPGVRACMASRQRLDQLGRLLRAVAGRRASFSAEMPPSSRTPGRRRARPSCSPTS